MKKITKIQIIQMRGYLSALNIVGLAPATAKTVMKLYRKVCEIVAEVEELQKELISKYEIKSLNNQQLDQNSEHFAEYAETYQSMIEESIDLSEFCTLTEDEALIALSKVDAPIAVIDTLAKFLSAEATADEKE